MTGQKQSGQCPIDHTAVLRSSTTTNSHPATAPETSSSDPRGLATNSGLANGTSHTPHNNIQDSLPNGVKFDHEAAAAGRCPVDHEALAAMQAQAAATGGKCPVDHEAMAEAQESTGDGPAEAAPKAVCPFGFGSVDAEGNSSNKTSLHCSKCSALFHDAVKTNCGHIFCRACVEPSPACLKCGASLDSLVPETFTQGLVDMFISEHTTEDFLLKRKEDSSEEKSKDVELLKAEFFLQIALQSFRGGNFQAADARLQTCRDKLMSLPAERQQSTDVRTQLGAVCGSQGDCSLQTGDARQAVHHYEASIQYLASGSTGDLEVQQALTVTQNKLGDLWYRIGNLESARGFYKQALDWRRQACEERPDLVIAQIDHALSLAKVADIEQALNESEEAKLYLSQARDLAERLSKDSEAADNKRLKALMAHLAVA